MRSYGREDDRTPEEKGCRAANFSADGDIPERTARRCNVKCKQSQRQASHLESKGRVVMVRARAVENISGSVVSIIASLPCPRLQIGGQIAGF